MSDKSVHIEGLMALRADLVEQRREAVGKRGRLAPKSVANSVEHWQRLIEAVDRALADENTQAPQSLAEISPAPRARSKRSA